MNVLNVLRCCFFELLLGKERCHVLGIVAQPMMDPICFSRTFHGMIFFVLRVSLPLLLLRYFLPHSLSPTVFPHTRVIYFRLSSSRYIFIIRRRPKSRPPSEKFERTTAWQRHRNLDSNNKPMSRKGVRTFPY